MAWGRGEACQLLVGHIPSPMALVHCHLHGALSDTVASLPGPPPYGLWHFIGHRPIFTTIWLFWAHQLILSLRSKGASLLFLSHHLGLSQDLILLLVFPEVVCTTPMLWWCKELLPGCHLPFVISAMGFKSWNSKGEHHMFFLFYISAVTVLTWRQCRWNSLAVWAWVMQGHVGVGKHQWIFQDILPPSHLNSLTNYLEMYSSLGSFAMIACEKILTSE